MKKIILLLLLFCICTNVKAIEKNANIYTDDYVGNVYIVKEKKNIKYYERHRFVKRSDNKIVYCLEPFIDINENTLYSGYEDDYTKTNLSKSDWEKIKAIAFFGYGYKNHTSSEWYSITQIMIWRIVDTNNKFYFTDTLNGAETTKYDSKIEEINLLVSNYKKNIAFNNNYDVAVNSYLRISTAKNVFDELSVTSDYEVEKGSNYIKIILNNDSVNGKVNLKSNYSRYNYDPIIMINSNSQKVFTPGDIDEKDYSFNINVLYGSIKIKKLDYDTNSVIPSGEGLLIGSKYGLYDENDKLIEIKEIDENNELVFSNLKNKIYYVKELESMKGYTLDQNTYSFYIGKYNLNQEKELKNKPIKETIKIYKYLEDGKLEPNISFNIINSNNEIVDTIITNEQGYCEKELYYGTYTFRQINSTNNYLKVDDFKVIIDQDSSNNEYKLIDKKFNSKIRIINKDLEDDAVIDKESQYQIINDEQVLESVVLNGEIIINNSIKAGNYKLKQIKEPDGYEENNELVEFTIDDSNEFDIINDELVYNITFYNKKEQIIKVEDTNTKINNNYSYIGIILILTSLFNLNLVKKRCFYK